MGTEAACLEVNIASIIKECNFRVPKSKDMKQSCNQQQGKCNVVPAPFLRHAMLEANSKDPWEMIPVTFAVAKEYDDTHENGNAVAHTKVFALWA
eukprot:3580975-Ditylum_brightwellii.AAC.2